LPIAGDRHLSGVEDHLTRANQAGGSVLKTILDPEPGRWCNPLRIEVGDVVRTAELERDDVVNLKG
jgi:hypothetical protein